MDTAAKLIPSAELFISMYVRKEALYVAQSCMYNQISVVGNIKTFDAIRNGMRVIDEQLLLLKSVDELELEKWESLRMILEILDGFYENCDSLKCSKV